MRSCFVRRACMTVSSALATALLVVVAWMPAHAETSRMLGSEVSRTPPMGIDPWYSHPDTLGAVDEDAVRQTADFLVHSGMRDLGYREFALGNWWKNGQRNTDGTIALDPQQWPHGVKPVTDGLHARGLTVRAYTDIGPHGCITPSANSFGYYQQDADTVSRWGLDALTVDWCGAYFNSWSADQIRAAYTDLAESLQHNAADRPVTLDIALYDPRQESDNSDWTSRIAETYRIGQDIGAKGVIEFSRVLASIDKMAAHPETTGPGHYRDPDMVLAGVGPITDDEGRLQMSMWSMLSAPLILGTDVLHMTPTTRATVTNPEIIAIDQDPLVRMATKLGEDGPGREVWVKRLSVPGERAVALLNRTDHSATISTSAQAAGLVPAGQYALRDVWQHVTTATSGRISATVPAHGVVVYRVAPITRGHSAGIAPDVSVAVSTPGVASAATGAVMGEVGRAMTLSVDVENHGRKATSQLGVALDLPTGWSAARQHASGRVVKPGGHARLFWRVTPAATSGQGAYALGVSTRFRYGPADLALSQGLAHASVQLVAAPHGSATVSGLRGITTTASGFEPVTVDPTPPVVIDGVTYPDSVVTPAPAAVDYFLGGRCDRLTSAVALDDHDAFGTRHHGRVIVQLLRDGVVAAQRTLETDAVQVVHLSLDVHGAKSLRINVIDAGGYWNYAFATVLWGGARLTCTR